ncbi:metallophosphoesterase [Pseudomonas sp. UBT]|uniref:metallophosphoesterase n=1 Tax=Pseudomonas sp. UBT TaxID=3239198 RepID=UPI003D808DB8
MTPTLGWLHISDLHFLDEHAWRDDRPLKKLIEDLETLMRSGLRVDLVLCTGDIGFGETKAEPLVKQYLEAKAFFDKVLATCNLESDRLFLVPGNHDIDRSKVRRSQTEWFRSSERNLTQINQDFRNSDAEIRQSMERLAAYRQFVVDHYPHISLDHNATFGAKVEIDGITVSLSGLNSAWTCVDNYDKDRIWLAGDAQLHACSKAIDTVGSSVPHLRLALIHHPQDWLQPAEVLQLRGRLEQDFDFLLHGHAHDQWVREITTPQHVVIAAGATTGESQKEFGYNLVQFAPGKTEVHLRSYDSKGGGGWIEENVSGRTKHGIWPLTAHANLPALPATATASTPVPSAPLEASPTSRGHYGLDTAMVDCATHLKRDRLLVIFGMAGVGKSTLVEELRLRSEWKNLRLVQVTAREEGGMPDFFGQIAPLLGIHDERPRPPVGETVAKIAEGLNLLASNAQPFFLHVQRAHLWLRNGIWRDANLGLLLEGLSRAYPESTIVLEAREKPDVGLNSYEVTGLPKQALADYLSHPPGLSKGWALSGDQRSYVFSRLGGGHGRGAHAYGLSLLVRLAEDKGGSPYDILRQYPEDYAQTLYDKLFRDLYENVLTRGERRLLFVCSLYRDGVHYSHLSLLEEIASAQEAGGALIRRRLLAENGDWLYLHDLAAEQARNLETDKNHTQKMHEFIAGLWLDELKGQRALMEANIRRALEAIYHLEQGGQYERVAEIAPNLFGRSQEMIVQALWRMEEKLIAQRQDKKVLIVLEYLLKVSPNDHQCMRFLGECRRRLFGTEDREALELFRQATLVDPGFFRYWANYGHAVIASKDEELIETFLTEVAEAPERARDDYVVAIQANALEAVKRDGDAADLRKEKIAAGSTCSVFYSNHAQWLLDKKADPKAAIEVLELARTGGFADDIAEAIYASALEADGRDGDAAALREEKIAAGSTNGAFYADHAIWLLDKKGDPSSALEVLKLAPSASGEVISTIRSRVIAFSK